MNLNSPEAFPDRVNYAAQCLVRGINSRTFAGCFEMSDGDAVVTALVRRASKNEKLRAAIARGWSELTDGLPRCWVETAAKYAAETDLNGLASKLRTKSQ